MSVRRYTIGFLISASVVVPILIGASCPPPQGTGIFGLVTTNTNVDFTVPTCNSGFVCIVFTNSTIVPVKVALYVNNGYDPANQCGSLSSFTCCTNPNSTVACPCPCPGAPTGNCKLNRQQLFAGCTGQAATANLSSINGSQTPDLAPAQSMEARLRCVDVKTLGAAVSRDTDNPVTNPADQNGPIYRDEPGGVACGQTVLFQVIDLNNTTSTDNTSQDLVTLALQAQFSH
jgi:hypothetical protein